MAAETRRICFGFQRRFLSIFFKFKGKQKTQFLSHSLVYKKVMVLKADERWHDIRWYRSRFLQTLISCNLSAKVYSLEIHTKMVIFWLVFRAKNLVKSDKLELIKGKILNLMFLDIDIPVLPIEIWLRVTQKQ